MADKKKLQVLDISGDSPKKKISKSQAKAAALEKLVKEIKRNRTSAEDDTKVKKAKSKKAKALVEEGTSKKTSKSKKENKQGRELALLKTAVEVGNKKVISKLNRTGMKSIIGDSAEMIQDLLETNAHDSAVSLMQKRLLQTLVDVLPYAENAVRASEGLRGVYQLNSLITSLRELTIDMQSTRDRGELAARLVDRVIRPAFLDIGMMLVQEEARLDGDIKDLVGVDSHRAIKQVRQSSLDRVAQSIKDKYTEVKNSSIQFLQG